MESKAQFNNRNVANVSDEELNRIKELELQFQDRYYLIAYTKNGTDWYENPIT